MRIIKLIIAFILLIGTTLECTDSVKNSVAQTLSKYENIIVETEKYDDDLVICGNKKFYFKFDTESFDQRIFIDDHIFVVKPWCIGGRSSISFYNDCFIFCDNYYTYVIDENYQLIKKIEHFQFATAPSTTSWSVFPTYDGTLRLIKGVYGENKLEEYIFTEEYELSFNGYLDYFYIGGGKTSGKIRNENYRNFSNTTYFQYGRAHYRYKNGKYIQLNNDFVDYYNYDLFNDDYYELHSFSEKSLWKKKRIAFNFQFEDYEYKVLVDYIVKPTETITREYPIGYCYEKGIEIYNKCVVFTIAQQYQFRKPFTVYPYRYIIYLSLSFDGRFGIPINT